MTTGDATMPAEMVSSGAAEAETFDSEQAWLAARRHGIGASEAAAILGVSPYKTALQLYCEKLELVEPDASDAEHLYWGRMLERPIARRYADLTGRRVVSGNPWTLHRSWPHPYMVATLDALTWADGSAQSVMVLEIKNVGAYTANAWADEPPVAFQIQVQHQLAVTGLEMGSIAGLIGGNRLVWFDVPRNEKFITLLIEREAAFWERLQKTDPPPVDGSDAGKALLRALYPREVPGLVVNLPGDAMEWDAELQEAKALGRQYDATKQELENKLKAAMGEAEIGVLPNGVSFTWKASERKGYVVEASLVRTLRRKAAK